MTKKFSAILIVCFFLCSLLCGTPEIWFQDIRTPLALSKKDMSFLARYAAKSILYPESDIPPLPVELQNSSLPCIVFITLGDFKSRGCVAMGAKRGIARALNSAIESALELCDCYTPRQMKIDVVQQVYCREHHLAKPLVNGRGLWGVAFDKNTEIALLPGELAANRIINRRQKLCMEKVHQYLKNHGKLRKFAHLCNLRIAKLYRFSTLSACCNGEQVVPLYCGFRTFENFTPSLLLQSARSAGNYLTHSVDEKGKFTYLYRPETDSIIPGYNILRHAGATYSMLELYEVTRDKALLAAARRALEYLVSSMRPCRLAGEDVLCVVEDGWVKLGGNALACIAIAKYIEISGDRRYFPELISLGRWIQLVQEESGRFFIHKQAFPNGELADFISRYYPGEALLAMARIYLLDPRETWLHTAKKGACYLIETRDAGLGLSQIGHDHWLIYALCDLYRICLDPKFLQHALHIARAITIKQRQKPHRFDWAGSFGSPPGSCPTATRMEGLCAAYRLARDFKKHEQAREILQAAKLGIGFQLHTQFTRESTIYLPNPLCCIGGFSSPKCFDIRIDCVQHNISSILAMYHILRCMEK